MPWSSPAFSVPTGAGAVKWITAKDERTCPVCGPRHGLVYGIPTELSVYQLVYNKKFLAEAGYDHPPATWAELEEMGAKIVQKNDQGVITRAGYAFGPSVAHASSLVDATGRQIAKSEPVAHAVLGVTVARVR